MERVVYVGRLAIGLGATVFSLLVVGCGGGGVNTTPVPAAVVTAPAVPSLTTFTAVTTSAAVPPAAATTLPTLTAPAGVDTGTSATIGLAPQAAGGVAATATASMSVTAPAGLPVLQSISRRPQSTRGTQAESDPISGILYFSFAIVGPPAVPSFTFPQAPTFTITLPSAFFSLPDTTFYLALYDPSEPALGWQSRSETCVANAATSTLVCNQVPPAQITILNNVTYYLALYAVSASAPSPAPEPSVTPIAVATNSPTPNPGSTATPSPNPGATAEFAATLTGGPQTIPLPAVNGVSGSVSIASSTGGAALVGSAATSPGHGFAPVSGTPVYALIFAPSGAASATGISATFNLPAAPPAGTRYVLAVSNGQAYWYYGIAGPGTVSGSTVTISSPLNAYFGIGTTYYIALYSLPSTGAATGTATISSGGTITLPSADGSTGSLTLGTTSATTTAPVTLFFDPPGNIPNPSTQFPAILYYEFTPAASVTITGTTTGTFTAPTGYVGPGPAIDTYVEIYDTSNPTYGWLFKAAGAGASTGTMTFTTTQPIVLTGGVTYAMAVYPSN